MASGIPENVEQGTVRSNEKRARVSRDISHASPFPVPEPAAILRYAPHPRNSPANSKLFIDYTCERFFYAIVVILASGLSYGEIRR